MGNRGCQLRAIKRSQIKTENLTYPVLLPQNGLHIRDGRNVELEKPENLNVSNED